MPITTLVLGGAILAIVIIAITTRSILATLAGTLLVGVALATTVAVAIGRDVADVVAYLDEPSKPVLLILAEGDEPLAAAEIHVEKINALRSLMSGLNSNDPVARAQAEIDFRTDFGDLIPVQHQGERLSPDVLHEVIDTAAHGLRPKELERLKARVAKSGFDSLTDQAYRAIVVRIDHAKTLLGRETTTLVNVNLHGDEVEAELDVKFLTDCVAAPDCGERLASVADQPSKLIRRLGTLTDLDTVLEDYPDIEQAVRLHVDYVPRTALANVLAAGALYAGAIAAQPPSERAGAVVDAMREGGIDIYPRTAVPRLVSTTFDVVPDALVSKIGDAMAGA